jgi:hypothetical protein
MGFRLSEKCAEQQRASALLLSTAAQRHMTPQQATMAVPETAEDLVVRNLIEALNRIHADLEQIELWTAALACFQEAVPQYQPSSDYLLPPRKQAARST